VAVKGDFKQREAMYAAMNKAAIDSPRGKFTLSAQHNRCRTCSCAEAKGNNQRIPRRRREGARRPGAGCKM